MTRYFKLCGKEKYLALSNQDAIDMLLADFAWYEIPAWDYERRNRAIGNKIHVTPEPRALTSGDDLDEDDFRNEGSDYYDLA